MLLGRDSHSLFVDGVLETRFCDERRKAVEGNASRLRVLGRPFCQNMTRAILGPAQVGRCDAYFRAQCTHGERARHIIH